MLSFGMRVSVSRQSWSRSRSAPVPTRNGARSYSYCDCVGNDCGRVWAGCRLLAWVGTGVGVELLTAPQCAEQPFEGLLVTHLADAFAPSWIPINALLRAYPSRGGATKPRGSRRAETAGNASVAPHPPTLGSSPAR